MINLLLNILNYQNNDKKIMIYFSNMRYVILQNFNLKLHLCLEKIKKTIILEGNLNQIA